MIASVEIRRYRDDDVLQVGGVHAASRHAAYAGLVAPESLARVTPQTQAEAWRRRLTEGPYPWSMLVVVHPDDRRVAGFVLGSGPGPVATLHAIHVLPELHGSGAGQLLHNDIVAEFRAWSCSTAQLWVLEGNARARRSTDAMAGRPTAGETPTTSAARWCPSCGTGYHFDARVRGSP